MLCLGVKNYKPKRQNNNSKLSISKSSIPKGPANKLPKEIMENSFYDVGSEDSFDSFDESMKIEIEDQTCLKNYLESTKSRTVKTTKALQGNNTQKFDFSKNLIGLLKKNGKAK